MNFFLKRVMNRKTDWPSFKVIRQSVEGMESRAEPKLGSGSFYTENSGSWALLLYIFKLHRKYLIKANSIHILHSRTVLQAFRAVKYLNEPNKLDIFLIYLHCHLPVLTGTVASKIFCQNSELHTV